jgi:DNA repair ATPase RecN
MMKRNLEETRALLQALVGASIDFDKVLQRIDEIRTTLVGIEGKKDDIDELLRFTDEAMSDLRGKRDVIDEIRRKGEIIVWERQVVSPHLQRKIEELEISDAAAELIPIGVETVGELCQYSASELGPPADPYVNELKDAIRIPYTLVLKP